MRIIYLFVNVNQSTSIEIALQLNKSDIAPAKSACFQMLGWRACAEVDIIEFVLNEGGSIIRVY